MDTFAKHINRRHIFKDLPNQMLVPKSDWDNYYNHYTIKVSSLSEFIEVISKLTQKSKDTEYNRLVYRGIRIHLPIIDLFHLLHGMMVH